MGVTVQDLIDQVMEQAKEKGFGIKPDEINVAEKIALLHSELSEAYEAYRKKQIEGKDGFKHELVSAFQRILHLAGIFEVDLERDVLAKLKANKQREWDWNKLNEQHTTPKR